MMGSLTPNEIHEVLESQVIARIGYVAGGRTWIVPVTYVYDGMNAVYVHSAEGAKIDAMRASPEICFEVEDIVDMGHWRTVVAQGHFEELWKDSDEQVMDLLATRMAPFPWGEAERPPRREEIHRQEGIFRPIVYRIRLLEKVGRFQRAGG